MPLFTDRSDAESYAQDVVEVARTLAHATSVPEFRARLCELLEVTSDCGVTATETATGVAVKVGRNVSRSTSPSPSLLSRRRSIEALLRRGLVVSALGWRRRDRHVVRDLDRPKLVELPWRS